MTNNLTQKEYKQIRDKLVQVISFDETGYRVMTYGNLNYKNAMDEIISQQSNGNHCLIVDAKIDTGVSRDEKDYTKFVTKEAEQSALSEVA